MEQPTIWVEYLGITDNDFINYCNGFFNSCHPTNRVDSVDKMLIKIMKKRYQYAFDMPDYYKPLQYWGFEDINAMSDWTWNDVENKPIVSKWLTTNREVHNAHTLFAGIATKENKIMDICKKIITIKQLILISFGNKLKDYSYENVSKIMKSYGADCFYICGFTKTEWDKYFKDKQHYTITDFVKLFNACIYKLYKIVDGLGGFKRYIGYKHYWNGHIYTNELFYIEDIIEYSDKFCKVYPTFIPQEYSMFYNLYSITKEIRNS